MVTSQSLLTPILSGNFTSLNIGRSVLALRAHDWKYREMKRTTEILCIPKSLTAAVTVAVTAVGNR